MSRTWMLVPAVVLVLLPLPSLAQEQPPGQPDAVERMAEWYRPGWFDHSTFYLMASSHNDIAYLDDPRGTADFRSESLILPALDLMNTDDTFALDIEATLYLKEFLDRHPERLDEVRRRVAEGRLSFGGRYTQFYEALFGGEALARQMYFGRKWLRQTLGGTCDTHIVWDTDIPQRTLQSPQVFAKSGIKYLMIGRFPAPGVHRWESPDGSGVVFGTNLYSSGWAPPGGVPIERYVLDLAESQRPFYEQHGIPDFGTVTMSDYSCPGPELPALVREYNAKAAAVEEQTGLAPPRMKLATAERYLQAVEAAKPSLPVYRQDWPNPWGYHHQPSHERLVTGAREAYNLLVNGERFGLIASLLDPEDRPYPREALTNGWEGLLYPDHGWCGERTLETIRVFSERLRRARDAGASVYDDSLRYIAGRVSRSKALGPAVVVFNPLSWSRTSPVSLTVPFERGECRPDGLGLVDRHGARIPCDWTLAGTYPDGTVREAALCFVAEDVPSIGYKTYYLSLGERAAGGRGSRSLRDGVIANRFYRLTLGERGIRSLIDKATGEEVFETGKFEAGEVFELGVGTIPMWPMEYTFYPDCRRTETLPNLGRMAGGLNVESVVPGEVKTVIGLSGGSEHLRTYQEITLYHRVKRIDLSTDLWWDGTRKRELRLAFPIRQPAGAQVSYDVPFGDIEVGRNEMGSSMPREVQNWIDVSNGGWGATLAVGNTAVHDIRDITTDPLAGPMIQPVLLCSLMDLEIPGQGEHPWWTQAGHHRYDFALTTHPGAWRDNWRFGWEFSNPLTPVLMRDEEAADATLDVYTDSDPPEQRRAVARTHTYGSLPEEYSFCSIEPSNLMVSTIKRCEDDDSVVVRYVDMEGKDSPAELRFFAPVSSVQQTNLIEEEGTPCPGSGKVLTLRSGPYSIDTAKLFVPTSRSAATTLPFTDTMDYANQTEADAVWKKASSYRRLTLTADRDHADAGGKSLSSQGMYEFGYLPLPSADGLEVEAWFYDSGDPDAFGGVIVTPNAPDNPRGSAELGIFPSSRFGGKGGGSERYTYYAGTGDWERQDSGIARSVGWHRVTFRVTRASGSISFDGQLLATAPTIVVPRRLYLGNPWAGARPVYFDDIAVARIEE